MGLLVGGERAKLYTWYSGRISLATHLLKCNVPPSTIQAMLRWQTDESLRAYVAQQGKKNSTAMTSEASG
jgi:hypothetical protein